MIQPISLVRPLARFIATHRRILRDLSLGFAGFALLITVLQVLYPSNRLLPSVEIQGLKLGGQPLESATKRLGAAYQKATVSVRAGGKNVNAPLAQIGVAIDQTATVRKAASYPFYQRIIPFSSFVIMVHRDTPVQLRFDDERLQYFAEQIGKDAYVPAKNAGVTIASGKANLVPAVPSQEFPVDATVHLLRQTNFTPRTQITLRVVHKSAKRGDNAVRTVLAEAQKAAERSLSITLGSEIINVDKATSGGWLEVTETSSGDLQLSLKNESVQQYLEQMQAKIYKAPGTTKIQLIDGQEVSRTLGQAGRGIDIPKAIELLGSALRGETSGAVTVPIVDLAPKVVYERTLSNTDVGLAALLNDIVKSKGNYGIAVMELDGRSGNVNGNKQYIAASTYKLFVAYGVFKEIDAGTLHWSDTIGGKSVETCFNDMIVVSDNACAKALGEAVGWSNIDDMMKSVGLTTTHNETGNHTTTANDLALFLYKLEKGTLVSGANRTRLLDAMKKQIYRSGIPAGTGVTVADKVGFLDNLIHDAAIVYGPKGPYVLVIMSDDSSWSQLADAAKQVHNFLKQ